MRSTYKFLLLILVTFSAAVYADYTIIHDQMAEKIKSPSLQNVKRLKIKLDNNLEAFIVSDPEAKKSGAALSVGVGFNHEPFEKVGVAHFVEHMLFLGTEKYPTEKEYHEFIQSRGGTNNAYTSSDKTVYSLEINNDHVLEALDRFSSFFVNPLFNESGLERERKAVNQEFHYRANLDSVRMHIVSMSLLDKNSNASIWRCGNEDTLKDVSRTEIVDWYEKSYSSNIMKLAVYSSLPMDQLVEQVDQCFSQVQNKNVMAEPLDSPVSQNSYLGKMVYVEPLKDVKKMVIKWELPQEYSEDLEYHTADLVSYVLGEESPKSLATLLKENGYIHTVSCGQSQNDTNISFFEMHLELTQNGLENRDQVIAHCYEAIHALQNNGIPRYRFDEMVTLSKLNYQYQSRPEAYGFVESVAAATQHENMATYPQKTLWPTKYSSKRAQDFVSNLQAAKATYFVMAPTQNVGKVFDQSEDTANVNFYVDDIANQTLAGWAHANPGDKIAISPPNPYIPNNLELVTASSDFSHKNPKVIAENDKMQVYYQADQDYNLPEANYDIFLLSPSFENTATNMTLGDLYSLSLSEALCQHIEQGGLAGLETGMTLHPKFGFRITVSGYSQKAPLFLSKILDETKSHNPQERDFQKYKDLLLRSYQNKKKQIPVKQAMEMVSTLLVKDYPTVDAKHQALENISFEDFQAYSQNLFDKVYIRSMVYGNVNSAQADQFTADMNNTFKSSATYKEKDHFKRAILDLTQVQKPRYYVQNTDQVGSSTCLMISHGLLDHKQRAAYEVMSKSISSPFFDTLRTKQQVGYLVTSFAREYDQKVFSAFVTQSNSCSTRDLLSRYELFYEEFLASLGTEEFNEEKFNTIRESLITNYMQPPVSIGSKASELTALAFEYNDFDRKEKCIQALQNLTFQDYINFCYSSLGRQNNQRIAVLVDGEMSSTPTLSYEAIQDINLFKVESFYDACSTQSTLKEAELGNG